MEHARPPAELSLDGGPAMRAEAWRKWRKLFEVFVKASGVSKESKEVQASLLVNLIGSAGYEVYTTFTFDEGESEDDINCLLKKFDKYFGAKPNITVRRFKFFTRNQEDGENIDQYVTSLRVLSQQCEFGDLQESLLRDKIVCGIVNNTVRDRLLRTDDLTLSKAIQICQAAEISKEESSCIDGSSSTVQVNAVQGGSSVWQARGRPARRGGGRRRGARGAGGGGLSAAARAPCPACGGVRCDGNERCPARNALCYVCDKKGHFSRVCEHKKVIRKVLNLSVNSEDSDGENSGEDLFYVNTIGEDKKWQKTSKEWLECMKCNNKKVMLKIDTGSMINVISKIEYINLGYSIQNLKPFTKRVHSFTGNPLPIVGTDKVTLEHNKKYYTLPFIVADMNCQGVLGLEGCITLGLINNVNTVNAINIEKYSCLFKGLGKLPGKYSIVVDKNVQPVVCPTRKIPLGLKGKLLEELRRMEGLGVVRKVTHPTDWVNAIVLVPKKDDSIRVCLDPRPLNRAVRRAHYSLPTVPELAARLRGAAVFSVLDARCGFWMVEIDDASADLCTFSTPFGRYQFLRLPYGINCAPEVFHAKLRQHLEDLEGVESFIDDIIVWGKTKEEHDIRLECLLQRAQNIGIKFNREKCKFGVTEIKYLGHKFDTNGMRPDDSKIKAIMEMPYPSDKKALERFLGMVNYLSKFIQNYSDCVNVLRSLLKKDSEWVWKAHHSEAVDKLKRKLASAPVLALYCERTPVLVSVDASSAALGAVLLQAGRPVEFASLTLTETQTSDLPDEEDKKSPVLLLGVNKISDSPSFVRRRLVNHHLQTGSIRFFRPPKSKYTRGLRGDERLEKIRQDLLLHKTKSDRYIPSSSHKVSVEPEDRCLNLNCAGNCICDRKTDSSKRGSFTFHVPPQRQSSLCPSEPYEIAEKKDFSENDIEFKYTEHVPDNQPGSSKQNSYNVTPKSVDRRHFLLSNLNERFRKTLSLDSRKIDTNRVPLSLPKEPRPKSLVNTSNIIQHFKADEPFLNQNFSKVSQPKKKRKSFFSLDTFFDSKKSDTSSTDDYCSSKYKRFELESDDSPLFHRNDNKQREKAPDLLNLPVIIDSVRKKQSDTRRQLEKLENHFYSTNKTVIDAIPKDATNQHGHTNRVFVDDDEVEYIEPIGSNTRSNFTSQSTLILEKNIPEKPDSILTIFTDETDIRLPSSTVSPKSDAKRENDLDSIGAYEIEVKESDILNATKELTVKVMDKSVDSIGSCSLDVDASTDFSDTTSGSLNLLTPSSTGSRVRDFTNRLQERAAPLPTLAHTPAPTPTLTPTRTPDDQTPTPRKAEFIKEPKKSYIQSDYLLKPPQKSEVETASHRSRHKKREVTPTQKKPSYLHLACSVNGYTNLTTYDSKLRQDINRSREASPIRPITHTYQYRGETGSLLVPVPVSANKLLLPTLGPHDPHHTLTARAPTKALTEPALSAPHHTTMADENKQLRNDFLGPGMTDRTFISPESKSFASTMLHSRDEVDDVREAGFKSSFSENNFRKTNGKESSQRLASESFTITSNGVSKRVDITKENGETLTSPMKSFIQQRVERLYGPGALAQGFLMQKRQKKSLSEEEKVLTEKSLNCQTNFSTPRKSNDSIEYSSPNSEMDGSISLPVLRHLRPEFRAQLPILSPKKNVRAEISPPDHHIPSVKTEASAIPVTNGTSVTIPSEIAVVTNGVSVIALDEAKLNGSSASIKSNGEEVRDGHYFLALEKKETERLIALAASAEKELESLQNMDGVESAEWLEEARGLLRSASGKARLLATQKMQQFQGLCYNNINDVGCAGGAFPTTAADLQGFWDMVCLQVHHVDQLYEHIARLKANGWKEELTCTKSATPSPSGGGGGGAGAGAGGLRRARTTPPVKNEKARLAAEKREADRKAMLEHRRRLARERQLEARGSAPGTSQALEMGIEGSQEVEIFVGKNAKSSTTAPQGDCSTPREDDPPPAPVDDPAHS